MDSITSIYKSFVWQKKLKLKILENIMYKFQITGAFIKLGYYEVFASPSGIAVLSVGLQPLAC